MTTGQLFASEDVLNNAIAAERRGDKSQAEALFKQAIDERTKALSAEDGSVGEYMHQLGRFYMTVGKNQEAEETLKRALDVVEKAYYAAHAKLAPILDDLAGLYINQEKLIEAEPVLVKLLDVVDKTMNGDHRYCFETLHKLSYVYRRLNKLPEAEKLLLKALKTIDTPLGPAEEFRFDLALVYMDLGKNDEAETNFKLAITGFDQRKNLLRLDQCLGVYAGFMKKLGKDDQAKRAEALAKNVRDTAGKQQHQGDLFPSTLLRA